MKLKHFLLILLLAGSGLLLAQPANKAPKPPMEPNFRPAPAPNFDAYKMSEDLKYELKLNDSQAEQIAKILQDVEKKIKANQKEMEKINEDNREKIHSTMDEMDKKIQTVLTREQKEEFYKLKKRHEHFADVKPLPPPPPDDDILIPLPPDDDFGY